MTIEVVVRQTKFQGSERSIREVGIFSFDSEWDFSEAVKKIRELLSLWTMTLAKAKKH